MPGIIVLGGGIGGLTAAMLLARDGHDVTVLEHDPGPVPDTLEEACEAWARAGVAQFHQAHLLQPRGRAVLDEELPDVAQALAAAGGYRFDLLSVMPPAIADRAPRTGDERFITLTGRRPVIEHVLARAAEDEPRVDVRRGTAARELTTARLDGVPHVTGVRTDTGDDLRADLVVDATGRRSPLRRWLAEAGAAPFHEEAEESGFVYYTRFFRARDGGSRPAFRAAPLTAFESFSILTLPADNDTWSVTLYIAAGDRPLKAMRHAGCWPAIFDACPRHVHWLDGEPISDVLAMGGVSDRYRRLASGGRPVATGIATVADAWACTNPSNGRGMALGMVHARALRDVAREHFDEPAGFAEAWHEATERVLTPWYRSTVAESRARLRALHAARAGMPPAPPSDPATAAEALLPVAAMRDPDLFRGFLETRACIATPEEVLARPGVTERVLALGAGGASPPLGPTRAQLLGILAAAPRGQLAA
jgi:2-polyprenyl-6-methoxyphenol hydroxylase-like FAD-dependent oxidoreductase